MGRDLPDSVIPFVLRHIRKFSFSPDNLPPEITSMFKRLRYLIELTRLLKVQIDKNIIQKMILFVLSFKNDDHGFGYGKSSLSDTMEALLILMHLGYPIESLGTAHFISICENEKNGFTDVPGTSLSCIENIHDGLLSSAMVGYTPRHIDQCLDSIQSCQNRTGG